MTIISTKNAPAAIGAYSQAIMTDNIIYTSGQIPLDPATGVMVEGGITEQTEQAIRNIKAILEEADSGLDKVVKTTCFITDINDFAEFNAKYAEFFTGCPARSCVEVSALPKGALVEIEVIAKR